MDVDVSHGALNAPHPGVYHQQKQPCGASFGFDGKLIQYHNLRQTNPTCDFSDKRLVTISQVVTLPEFVARCERFDYALETENMEEFCKEKAQEVTEATESKVWQFLQASFSSNPTQSYLSMLGFDSGEMFVKLDEIMGRRNSVSVSESVEALTEELASLGRGVPDGYGANQPAENGEVNTLVRSKSCEDKQADFFIPTDDSEEGLLNQALLSGNTEFAVDLCLKQCRWADALILASTGGPELIKKTQIKYFKKCRNDTSNMILAVVTRDLRRLVEHCDLNCWKEALATALTYSDPLGFTYLAETLGRRLQSSHNEKFKKCALLCYISCGNISHLVESWASNFQNSETPEQLQDVVEQLMVLRKVAETHKKEFPHLNQILTEKLIKYGTLLVSQGCLKTALKYISDSTDPEIIDLKERVNYALGINRPAPAPRKSISYPAPAGKVQHPAQAWNNPQGPPMGTNYGHQQQQPTQTWNNPPTPTGGNYAPGLLQQAKPWNNPQVSPMGTNYGSSYGQQQTHTQPWNNPPAPPAGTNFATGNLQKPAQPWNNAQVPPMNTTYGTGHFQQQPAWNDPPPLKAKPPKPSTTPQPLAAITHPIFGSNTNSGAPMEQQNPSAPPITSFGPPFAPPPANQNSSYGQLAQNAPPNTPYGQPYAPQSTPQNTFLGQSAQTAPPITSFGAPFAPPPANQNPSYGQMAQNAPPITSFRPPFAPPPTNQNPSYGQMAQNAPPIKSSGPPFAPPPTNQNPSYGQIAQNAPPITSFGQSFPPTSASQNPSYGQMAQNAPPNTSFGQSFPPTPANQNPSYGQMAQNAPLNTSFGPPANPNPSYGQMAQNAPPNTSFGKSFTPTPSSQNNQNPSYGQMTQTAPPNTSFGQSFTPTPSSQNNQNPSYGQMTQTAPPNTSFGQSFTPTPSSQNNQNPSYGQMAQTAPSNTSFGKSFTPPPSSELASLDQPAQTQSSIRKLIVQTPAAEPKGPIPAEHEELPKVLEELRSACYNSTDQPQMKRKLEDVARKLEIFTEKLRDGSLSPKTLQFLHHLIDSLRNKDYQLALSFHTKLVTSGNFSEISSFLPAVKILIQSAAQLGVFL